MPVTMKIAAKWIVPVAVAWCGCVNGDPNLDANPAQRDLPAEGGGAWHQPAECPPKNATQVAHGSPCSVSEGTMCGYLQDTCEDGRPVNAYWVCQGGVWRWVGKEPNCHDAGCGCEAGTP